MSGRSRMRRHLYCRLLTLALKKPESPIATYRDSTCPGQRDARWCDAGQLVPTFECCVLRRPHEIYRNADARRSRSWKLLPDTGLGVHPLRPRNPDEKTVFDRAALLAWFDAHLGDGCVCYAYP